MHVALLLIATVATDFERLEAWLAATRDLEARFVQTLVSGALGTGPAETGRLLVARPGRMRWDYEQPERKVAIVDGHRTLLYVEEDRQLYEGTLDGSEAGLVDLLAADGSLATKFELRPPPLGSTAGSLVLKPREESAFGELTVVTRRSDGAIRSLEVRDVAGNVIRYEFEVVGRNRGIDPERFDFRPPPGTEIVAQP